VSGGERKRVAVGVELVARPPLLFLDEPTSGLDAATALSLVRCLRSCAKQDGMAIVASVHQPRSNIFFMFDRLLLLSCGQPVYFGPVDACVPNLEEALGEKLPPLTNPADWIIDLTIGASEQLIGRLVERLKPIHHVEGGARAVAVSESAPRWVTSPLWQFRALLARASKQQRGDVFNKVNVFQILAVAAIASVLWSGSTNVHDLTGVLFFVNIQQAFNALTTVLRLFPAERDLMLRERRGGAYRMLPYFFAKSCSDTLAILVLPVVYACIIYFSVGLRRDDASHFFAYLALSLGTVFTGQSFGLMLSLAIPDLALVTCVSFVAVLFTMLFGGFYVNVQRIPVFVRWVRYTSFMYWGFGGMVINEFGGRNISCADVDHDGEFGAPCPFDGTLIVTNLGYDENSVGGSIGMLLALALAFRLSAYLCLRFGTNVHSSL